MYQYYNNNPYNRHIDDCSIRAISLLTNRDWHSVYDELSDYANKRGLMMDSVESIEEYLDERYPRECHYAKTIGEFAEEYPYGKYAISTNGHLSAILDGYVMDTFDPRNKVMRCAWRIR